MKYLVHLKIAIIICVLYGNIFGQEMPGYPLPTEQILKEIQSHQKGIAVWWTGNAGWLIKSDGILMGIDLELYSKNKIYQPPISPSEAAGELDILFITHGHGDHFHTPTVKDVAEKHMCTFVVPENCVEKARKCGISEDRIIIAKPKVPFEVKGIHVQPVRALHGAHLFSVSRNANMQDCGYLLTIQEKKIFHPGDTVLLQDHFDLRHVDVLFVSPTEHNMHIRRAMIFINQLDPDYIFPQHFETYITTPDNMYWTKGYPDELKKMLSEKHQERYFKLKQGEKFVIK